MVGRTVVVSRWRERVSAHGLAVEAALALVLATWKVRRARGPDLVLMLGEPVIGNLEREVVTADEASLRQARRVGRMVQRVAKLLPWHPTCLRQALATQWLLRRRGVRSVLHLGVADAASMDAHAWVTVNGWKVVGQVARPFAPVAAFEA